MEPLVFPRCQSPDARPYHPSPVRHGSGHYLQNQMRDLMKNASGVKELLDDGKEIQLSEQEHQVYQEYRRLRSEMDALERKHFYLAGQISVMEDLR